MKTEKILTRVCYLVFSLGFILFLGSIFSFMVMNMSGEQPTVQSIYQQRLFVIQMIHFMTIPGLALIVAGDILLLSGKNRPFAKGWMWVVQIIIALLVVNSAFFIVPTATAVNKVALEQLKEDTIQKEYLMGKNKEDILGAINFLMAIGLLLVLIFSRLRHKAGINTK